jgi:HK97 family phage prohead protease
VSITDHESREALFGLEVRNAETMAEERVMRLLLVPYGEVSHLTKYPQGERFLKGAFRKAASEFRGRKTPLYLFRAHEHSRAVGRATSLTDTAEGPIAEFKIAGTPAGDEVIQEHREGLLSAVSVGFRAIADSINRNDGVREVREAALLETSVLPIGAYDGAKVLEYREPTIDLSAYRVPPPPTIDPALPWGRRNPLL